MIYRKVFISFIVIEFAAEVWSHVEIEAEDYFFPLEASVNYCKMADQCSHDFVKVCGQNAEGLVRMFNDVCDLFEYNCDEKQKFGHVKSDVCAYSQVLDERLED